jgi:hypothetical protein
MQALSKSTENGGEDEKKVQSRNRRFFIFLGLRLFLTGLLSGAGQA